MLVRSLPLLSSRLRSALSSRFASLVQTPLIALAPTLSTSSLGSQTKSFHLTVQSISFPTSSSLAAFTLLLFFSPYSALAPVTAPSTPLSQTISTTIPSSFQHIPSELLQVEQIIQIQNQMSTTSSTPITTTMHTGSNPFVSRQISQRIESIEQSEGQGARVRRSIGGHSLRNFDPFLMLDEYKVAAPAGFPDHPHRGFETVTYQLPESKGWMTHEDCEGAKGTIKGGDLQWMTAGRGILHAEMPANDQVSHGLQLWVNLSSKDKMCAPRYQELSSDQVPKIKVGGVHVSVIAGESLGVKSPIKNLTPVHYLHFTLDPHTELEQFIPPEFNGFIYTLSGELMIGSNEPRSMCTAHHTVTLTKDSKSTGIYVATGEKSASFVLLAGQPINEPIIQQGPFVMNTRQEIMQTFQDFQDGKNGFESARGWHSKIGAGLRDAGDD